MRSLAVSDGAVLLIFFMIFDSLLPIRISVFAWHASIRQRIQTVVDDELRAELLEDIKTAAEYVDEVT